MAEEPENVEEVDAASEAPETTSASEPASTSQAETASAEVATPKERRARARAEKAGKRTAGKERTAEERQAERDDVRTRKARLRKVERQRARTKARAAHATGQTTAPREHEPGVQKIRQGVVVSDKADKTITVRIDVTRRHRRYAKIVRTSNTLHAHDETNDAHIGDTVVVREARPLSRTKRWRLIEVLERAK
jgi:small subunit ribosomal protein S17